MKGRHDQLDDERRPDAISLPYPYLGVMVEGMSQPRQSVVGMSLVSLVFAVLWLGGFASLFGFGIALIAVLEPRRATGPVRGLWLARVAMVLNAAGLVAGLVVAVAVLG